VVEKAGFRLDHSKWSFENFYLINLNNNVFSFFSSHFLHFTAATLNSITTLLVSVFSYQFTSIYICISNTKRVVTFLWNVFDIFGTDIHNYWGSCYGNNYYYM
jgi:hypothetical protein